MRVLIAFFFFISSLQSQNLFEQGVTEFEKGNFNRSEQLFKKHLEQDPHHLKTDEYLGDIEAHRNNWDEAISIYKELSERIPNNADYHYKYGGAMGMKASENRWFALMNYKEIRFQFEETIRLNPKHIDAHWALVEYYLQLPGIFGGGEDKAKDYAHRLMKISKVDGYLAFGRIAEFYKKFSEAEKSYIRANKIGQSVHTFQTLAKFYEKHGHEEKAVEVYEQGTRQFPGIFGKN